MGDIFSDIQLDVPGDTYETLGINKENVRSDAYVVDQVSKWLRGEIEEEPDVGAIWATYPDYDHGMALGTSAEIGRLFPEDPRVTNWADRQKYNLSQAAEGRDPKVMNALGTMFTQGIYRGQQQAIKDLLGEGEGEPTPVPTPQPTPQATPQAGSVPGLIEQLKGKSADDIRLMYQTEQISYDQMVEGLAALGESP